ncbi:MAG TPA: ABC transporter substrate-binding protein [Verrucomicrobiae bacterium]|jgi:NitT/TauT family transport system substrate-binding protein|nr:ABC transporter substrate-binding protein [Verrucomicrobiae bacterium]
MSKRNLALTSLVLLFGAAFCASSVAAAEPINIRAAYPSVDVQYLPAYVAKAKGLFKDEGLEVELIVMQGGRAGVQALAGGSVHFAMQIGATLPAIWNGADFKIVAQMLNMLPFSFMVRPEIQRLEELRGKRIGLSVGTTTHALVHELFKLNGFDADKGFEYVNIAGAAPRIAALEKGLIAAAPMAPPGDLKAIQAGLKRLLFFGDVLPEISATGLVTSSLYIKENPRAVERMVRAIVRGTLAARDDPVVALEVMQGPMKMSADEARETYRLVRRSLTPVLTEAAVRNMARLVSSSSKITQTKEPKDYLDESFLNRALADLNKK